MKNILTILYILLCAFDIKSQSKQSDLYFKSLQENLNYEEISKLKNSNQRAIYNSNFLRSPVKLQKIQKKITTIQSPNITNIDKLGPNKVLESRNKNNGLGRVNVIKFDENSPQSIYVGTPYNGLWNSEDSGKSWKKIFGDEFNFIGISDIDITYNSNGERIILVATGDVEQGIRYGGYTLGLFETEPNNKYIWKQKLNINFNEKKVISKIIRNPLNFDEILVFTNSGILKTKDEGLHWNQVADSSKFYRDISSGKFLSNLIYTSTQSTSKDDTSKIYFSKDFGESWQNFQLNELSNKYYSRIKLEYLDLYQRLNLITYNIFNDSASFYSYKSNKLETLTNKLNLVGAQGLYNLALKTSPFEDNLIYAGGVNLYISTDKGVSWKQTDSNMHVDMHALEFNPNQNELFCGNDGGIFKSIPTQSNWKNLSNSIDLAQIYSSTPSKFNKDELFVGTQDNGGNKFNRLSFKYISSGDPIEFLNSQKYANKILSKMPAGNLLYSDDFGESFKIITNEKFNESHQWVHEIKAIPNQEDQFLIAFNNFWNFNFDNLKYSKVSNINDNRLIDHFGFLPSNPSIIYYSKNNILFKYDISKNLILDSINFPKKINTLLFLKSTPNVIYLGFDNLLITKNDSLVKQYSKTLIVKYDLETKLAQNINSDKITSQIIDTYNLTPSIYSICVDDSSNIYLATSIGILYLDNEENLFLIDSLPTNVFTDIKYNNETGYLIASSFGSGVFKLKIKENYTSKPKLNFNGKVEICEGDSLRLIIENLKEFDKIHWSNNESEDTLTVKSEGKYFLTAYKNSMLENSDIVEVSFSPKPDYHIKLIGTNPFCDGDSITLKIETTNLDVKNLNYIWSNGMHGDSINISNSINLNCNISYGKNCFLITEPLNLVKNPNPSKPTLTKKDNILITDEGYKYAWYYNGIKIDVSDFNNQIFITHTGVYSVTIYDSNNCHSSTIDYIFENPTSDTVLSINIFPNPTETNLNFEIFSNEIHQVKYLIFDALGQLIVENNLKVDNTNYFYHKIDISNFLEGIYCLKFEINSKSYVKKFVILRK